MSLLVNITLLLLCLPAATAGTFKRITIDGSFSDWAGVPIAYTDEQDAPGLFDFKTVQVANDDQFLYLRVTLYEPANYGSFHHHVFIDGDNDPLTGMGTMGLGSEMMIEDGSGWQQKNGQFNEGAASGLDWAAAPSGVTTQFEARISRASVDAEKMPVFTQGTIALAIEVQNLSWVVRDAISEAIPYEFASAPGPFHGNQILVNLTNTTWSYNASGTDLSTNWLTADYDDQQAGWQSGQGLFGFGTSPGTYPAGVRTSLSPAHTTYYFRTRFNWNYDVSGIGLVVSNYVSDGIAVYLNGEEVKRLRLPDGPISWDTPAKGGPSVPGQAEWFSLPAGGLVLGENILQVEVHQADSSPGELTFGLSLIVSDSLPPQIEDITQPADRNVNEGEATTFEAGRISGSPPLSYQWFKDASPIEGATNASFSLPIVLFGDAGSYHLEITNAQGKIASRAAILSTTAIPVSINDGSLPKDVSVLEGENATFAIAVNGSPVLAYQWFKDGAAIDGATQPEFILNDLQIKDAGKYWVVVSNRLNSVVSRQATLIVQSDKVSPSISTVIGSGRQVVVTFTEPVDTVSASQTSHYALNGGLQVLSAQPNTTDPREVVLTTSQQTFGTVYTLTTSGVQDRFGNLSASSRAFRSAMEIDGNFDDWAGIQAIQSEAQETEEGIEFKDFYITNDENYLYLRFSFFAPVGPLTTGHYYHINLDADDNAETGFLSGGAGIEVMIENGNGYQQKNGAFNEGGIVNLDLQLAPQIQTHEFEVRLSRKATYETDGLPVFASPSIRVVFGLISTGWASIDLAPQGGVPYEFITLPPLPDTDTTLKVKRSGNMVEISWNGNGVLEWSPNMGAGSWIAITSATSPYMTETTGVTRYYRIKK